MRDVGYQRIHRQECAGGRAEPHQPGDRRSIWEAAAAELLENDGLNFTIPYLRNGRPSDYLPDIVLGADWRGPTRH
jgi:hypothetical protein